MKPPFDINDVRNEPILRSMIVPMLSVGTSDHVWQAIGTAFVVQTFGRKALLVTAAHNLRHLLPRGSSHPSTPREFLPKRPPTIVIRDHALHVLAFLDGCQALATVDVAWLHDDWDLAVLGVTIPESSGCRFTRYMTLDTRPLEPSVSQVVVAGYGQMQVEQVLEGDLDEQAAQFIVPLLVRWGDVHGVPEGRVVYQGPAVQIGCRIASGMSGGPVFNVRDGRVFVRAVARSDFSYSADNMAEGNGEQALASLIWPIAGFRIDFPVVRDGVVAAVRNDLIADLIRDGAIDDVGAAHEHVLIEEEPGVLRQCYDS